MAKLKMMSLFVLSDLELVSVVLYFNSINHWANITLIRISRIGGHWGCLSRCYFSFFPVVV